MAKKQSNKKVMGCTQMQAAYLAGVSDTTVRNYLRSGKLQKLRDGKINPCDVMLINLGLDPEKPKESLKRSIQGVDEKIGSLEKSAMLNAHYDSEIKRLKFEKEDKQLLAAKWVNQFLADCLHALRSSVESLAKDVSNELASIDNPAEIRIFLNKALKGRIDEAADEIESKHL